MIHSECCPVGQLSSPSMCGFAGFAAVGESPEQAAAVATRAAAIAKRMVRMVILRAVGWCSCRMQRRGAAHVARTADVVVCEEDTPAAAMRYRRDVFGVRCASASHPQSRR